jgi:diacylglycerol kinase (ATP)
MISDQPDATPYKHKGATRLWKAMLCSFSGLGYALQEAAFRLEVIVGSILIVLSCFLPVEVALHLLLIGSVLLVLIIEILNSAIEAVVDDISFERRELAKQAKDMGSAAVFIALLNCGLCWAYIIVANWDQLFG